MRVLEAMQHAEIIEVLNRMRAQAMIHAEDVRLKAGLKLFIQAIDDTKTQCEQFARRENTVAHELKLLVEFIQHAKTGAEHDAFLYRCILKEIANALDITEEEAIKSVQYRWLWSFSHSQLLQQAREQKIESAMEELTLRSNHLASLQQRPVYDADFAMEGSGMEKDETHSSLLDKPGHFDKIR